MAKIVIAGEAVVVTSAVKLEDYRKVAKYRPKALVLLGGEDGIPHTGMDERSWNSEKHAYGWFNGEGDYYVLYFVLRDGDEYYTAATFSSSVRGDG